MCIFHWTLDSRRAVEIWEVWTRGRRKERTAELQSLQNVAAPQKSQKKEKRKIKMLSERLQDRSDDSLGFKYFISAHHNTWHLPHLDWCRCGWWWPGDLQTERRGGEWEEQSCCQTTSITRQEVKLCSDVPVSTFTEKPGKEFEFPPHLLSKRELKCECSSLNQRCGAKSLRLWVFNKLCSGRVVWGDVSCDSLLTVRCSSISWTYSSLVSRGGSPPISRRTCSTWFLFSTM